MPRLRNQFTIVLVTISIFPQFAAAQRKWYQITEQEAGFSISFPGQPTYEQKADATHLGQEESYKFFYENRLLKIIFAPLSKEIHTAAELNKAFSEITRVQATESGILLRQLKLPDGALLDPRYGRKRRLDVNNCPHRDG